MVVVVVMVRRTVVQKVVVLGFGRLAFAQRFGRDEYLVVFVHPHEVVLELDEAGDGFVDLLLDVARFLFDLFLD